MIFKVLCLYELPSIKYLIWKEIMVHKEKLAIALSEFIIDHST